jgi:hypothetical protein
MNAFGRIDLFVINRFNCIFLRSFFQLIDQLWIDATHAISHFLKRQILRHISELIAEKNHSDVPFANEDFLSHHQWQRIWELIRERDRTDVVCVKKHFLIALHSLSIWGFIREKSHINANYVFLGSLNPGI